MLKLSLTRRLFVHSHKIATINVLIDRLVSLPFSAEAEIVTIKHLRGVNGFTRHRPIIHDLQEIYTKNTQFYHFSLP